MSALTRRAFAVGVAGAVAGRPARAEAARVVVVGGGCGGATVARYLARSGAALSVTLIEPKTRFTTCFFSNLYLAGLRSLDSLSHGYEALAQRDGVRVLHDRAIEIDPVGRAVALGSGAILGYDRLVLAPGIDFRDGAIAGYDSAAMQVMPHAWEAGPQTELLRRQLQEMEDGGTVVIVAPPDPFRCPPGPYERASLIAAYLQREKPRSRIQILDAKDSFFEQELFEDGWRRHYPGMIEWLPAQFTGGIEAVRPAERAVVTPGQTYRGAVVNVIPPQQAGAVARRAGLADASGWCPVDPVTYESRRHPGIHVVGDSASVGIMPKSAFVANSQAKACAIGIVAGLTGAAPTRPFLYNTCYTFLAPDDVVSDAISFRIAEGQTAIAEIAISKLDERPEDRRRAVAEAEAWYAAFTRDMFG